MTARQQIARLLPLGLLVLLVIALFGLAIWPVRSLYLTLKENSDERWKRTVL